MRRNSEPFKLLSGVVSDPGRKFPHNEEVKVDLLSQSGNPAIRTVFQTLMTTSTD
jgi:hypothetical protein